MTKLKSCFCSSGNKIIFLSLKLCKKDHIQKPPRCICDFWSISSTWPCEGAYEWVIRIFLIAQLTNRSALQVKDRSSFGEWQRRRLCLRSTVSLARALSSPSSRDWDARVSVLGFDFLIWLASRDLNAVCCSWYCVHLKCLYLSEVSSWKVFRGYRLPYSFTSLTAGVRLFVFAWPAPPASAVSNFFAHRPCFCLLRPGLVLHGPDSEIVFIGGTSSCPINLISKYYHIGNNRCNQLG